MRTYKFLTRASLVFVLLAVLLLATCKKDDDDPAKDNYRVTKSEWYYNQQLQDSSLYEYQGDNLTMERGYYSGVEYYRTAVDYPDANSAVILYSYYSGGEWYEEDKETLKLENGHVTEFIDYEYDGATWNPSYKEVYTYTNNKVVEFTDFDYSSGNWVPEYKTVFEYDGNKPMQTISYYYDEYGGTGWNITFKEVMTYNGDKFNYLIGYDYYGGTYTEEYKIVFQYTDNLLTGFTEYYYESGTWTQDGAITYTYDSHSNLSSQSTQYGGESYKTQYYYTKGTGNYAQIMNYYGYGFYSDILPHPTKAAPGNKTHSSRPMGKFFGIK
jgi:hypothetical protein